MKDIKTRDMKIENQVCSESQARKLKGLGVEQDSIFVYYTGLSTELHGVQLRSSFASKNVANAIFAAYTVAELGEMLPCDIPANSNVSFADLKTEKEHDCWNVFYEKEYSAAGGYSSYKDKWGKWFSHADLANALAQMLIHLIEEKIISPVNPVKVAG